MGLIRAHLHSLKIRTKKIELFGINQQKWIDGLLNMLVDMMFTHITQLITLSTVSIKFYLL